MNQTIRTITGEVTDVFAHRFVVATADGRVLADLGPEGAAHVTLEIGDTVAATGETRPSELKVTRLVLRGGDPVEIRHGPKHKGHEGDVSPAAALRTAEAHGFTVVGEPRRKPKHFEVTGRDEAGDLVALHIEHDGTLRKSKPLKTA